MQETWVRSLGHENPLEEGQAVHSSILAWRIPWTEQSGGLQSLGSQRVGHNWVTNILAQHNYVCFWIIYSYNTRKQGGLKQIFLQYDRQYYYRRKSVFYQSNCKRCLMFIFIKYYPFLYALVEFFNQNCVFSAVWTRSQKEALLMQ